MTNCPHCGKPLDARPTLQVFPANRLVRRGDKVIRLGISEWPVFEAMHEARPMPVAKADLQDKIASGRDARVVVFKLREKLPPLGLGVESCGKGFYRLVEHRR